MGKINEANKFAILFAEQENAIHAARAIAETTNTTTVTIAEALKFVATDDSNAISNREKTKTIVMVGIPGSGKSTVANIIVAKNNYKLLSADIIREEWYGDAAIQGDGKEIFAELYSRMSRELKRGNSVILDNTATTPFARKQAISIAKENRSKLIAIFVNTCLEECKRRNAIRSRHVPEDILDKMAAKLIKPTEKEGFDKVFEV